MKKKVKIQSLPKAAYGGNIYSAFTPYQNSWRGDESYYKSNDVNKTLKPVDRELANLEAEEGETALTTLNGLGIPEFYKIGGKRHSEGGTPLNLPENSFIFSDTRKMKVKDEEILKRFGKSGKKAMTPADISKQYDINKYLEILSNPDSSRMEIDTAQLMIQNFNNKLGELALVQESKKGFPNGVPAVSMPFMMNNGLDVSDFLPDEAFGGDEEMEMFKNGGASGKRRVRVLSTFNKGGQVSKDKYPSYIPKEANLWDASSPDFDRSKVKSGDYVLRDGKYRRYQSTAVKPVGELDERLGSTATAYSHLENEIKNNEKLQDAMYENYAKQIKDSNMPKEQKERLLSKGKDFAIQSFLKAQKQNYALSANNMISSYDPATGKYNVLPEDKIKEWDKFSKGVNNSYKEAIKKLGFDDELTDDEAKAFQALYRSGWDAQKKEGNKDIFKNFQLTPLGLKDAHGRHTYDDNPISPVDGYTGNTTVGQLAYVKSLSDVDEVDFEIPQDDEPKSPYESPEVEHLSEQTQAVNAPWWAQDIVNIAGAAADLGRVKKFSPWIADSEVALPNPTFLDPTRQLAANMEMANAATEAAATFAGPNAFNARANQIQAQASGNAADIIGNIHNQNVQIANNFELNRNQIMNQAMNNKSRLATELYGRNTIANQQFENEKNAARQNLRQAYIQGLTNRAQSQSLNTMYQDYQHDPSSGGFTYFNPQGDKIEPKAPSNSSMASAVLDLKKSIPGISDSDAIALIKLQYGAK